MARPVRVDVKGGWYHITARGTERRTIFADERDQEHFLELLEEVVERYGVEIHAYCLMSNHYHLLIRTPNANASAAVQWLNVSYSVWFNRRRDRVGHVFQGRFGSTFVDEEGTWAMLASVYIHLNPIRTEEYGLGKAKRRAEGGGLLVVSRAEVKRRLAALKAYRWSSFDVYTGYRSCPKWLTTFELLARVGGEKAYRRNVYQHVTRGEDPADYDDVATRVAIGSKEFLAKVRRLAGRMTKEQPGRRQIASRVDIRTVVRLVEEKKGERWVEFSNRHNDWGRDLVIYLARKRTGLTLGQIGEALGIAEYKTVGKAVERFEASLTRDVQKAIAVRSCLKEMSHVET